MIPEVSDIKDKSFCKISEVDKTVLDVIGASKKKKNGKSWSFGPTGRPPPSHDLSKKNGKTGGKVGTIPKRGGGGSPVPIFWPPKKW